MNQQMFFDSYLGILSIINSLLLKVKWINEICKNK